MELDPGPASVPRRRSGYLVLLTPRAAFNAYIEREVRAGRNPYQQADLWADAAARIPRGDLVAYAGWDRAPVRRALSERELAEWSAQRERLIRLPGMEDAVIPCDLGWGAAEMERLMLERLGEGEGAYAGDDSQMLLIPTLAIAQEVRAAAADPSMYDIIHVARTPTGVEGGGLAESGASQLQLLGYEVGTWPGPYSVIADAMVLPMWHGAPEQTREEFMKYAEALNENDLFASVAEADAFLAWYQSQDWAGEEGGTDLVVARVDDVV